jgi:inner membrane protein COX18
MNPYTSWMLPWTQIPIFIINSSTIRGMCGLPAFSLSIPELFESEFANGGALWFTNLLQTDPTMILPLCIGACHIANLSLSLEAPKQPQASKDSKIDYTLEPPPKPSKTQQIVKKTFTTIGGVMSIAFIPIAAISPSGLALYWLTSALFSLIQNIALRTKLSKKIFNY